MTTLQIDTDDKNVIEEIKRFAMQKFHFKVEIAENNTSALSSYVETRIKNAKSTNTQKAKQFKNALENLHSLMDSDKIHLSLNQAKENYFTSQSN